MDPEEIRRVANAMLIPTDRALTLTLGYVGMRIGEAIAVTRWQQP